MNEEYIKKLERTNLALQKKLDEFIVPVANYKEGHILLQIQKANKILVAEKALLQQEIESLQKEIKQLKDEP